MGKEEIARNKQFLPFPQCFLLNQKTVYPFVKIFNIISLFAAELEEPKIGLLVKGLTILKKKHFLFSALYFQVETLCLEPQSIGYLTISQMANFRFFQTQRVYRQQF